MNKSLIAAAVLACTAAAATTVVQAQTAAAPTAAATPYGNHHGHHHSPFMRALKQLDLSEAQKASIHQIFEARHGAARAEHVEFRAQHRAFAALDPSSPDYQQQVNGYADAAAAQARQRTQDMAQVKAQVVALLTPAQKAQFLAALTAAPAHGRFAPPAG